MAQAVRGQEHAQLPHGSAAPPRIDSTSQAPAGKGIHDQLCDAVHENIIKSVTETIEATHMFTSVDDQRDHTKQCSAAV